MRPAFDEARVRIEDERYVLSGEGLLERLRAVDDTVASVIVGPELERTPGRALSGDHQVPPP
ncbi:MAG: hypothetical protein M3546_13670 [Actinomycetota bacterium]|nr:hypothetical protein [Actinomycetota bacterium]